MRILQLKFCHNTMPKQTVNHLILCILQVWYIVYILPLPRPSVLHSFCKLSKLKHAFEIHLEENISIIYMFMCVLARRPQCGVDFRVFFNSIANDSLWYPINSSCKFFIHTGGPAPVSYTVLYPVIPVTGLMCTSARNQPSLYIDTSDLPV